MHNLTKPLLYVVADYDTRIKFLLQELGNKIDASIAKFSYEWILTQSDRFIYKETGVKSGAVLKIVVELFRICNASEFFKGEVRMEDMLIALMMKHRCDYTSRQLACLFGRKTKTLNMKLRLILMIGNDVFTNTVAKHQSRDVIDWERDPTFKESPTTRPTKCGTGLFYIIRFVLLLVSAFSSLFLRMTCIGRGFVSLRKSGNASSGARNVFYLRGHALR